MRPIVIAVRKGFAHGRLLGRHSCPRDLLVMRIAPRDGRGEARPSLVMPHPRVRGCACSSRMTDGVSWRGRASIIEGACVHHGRGVSPLWQGHASHHGRGTRPIMAGACVPHRKGALP
jgi:hypothetical protein